MIPSVAEIVARGEEERDEDRERPEDEDEDEQRDRNRDVELADLQVLVEDRVEIVLDRRLAADEHLGARDLARGGAHVVRVALRVGRLEVRDDRRGDDVRRDGLHERDLRGRQLARTRARPRPRPRGRAAAAPPGSLRAHDQGERAGRLLAEVLLEDRVGARRLRPGQGEAVRQEVGEAARRDPGDDEDRRARPRPRPSGSG